MHTQNCHLPSCGSAVGVTELKYKTATGPQEAAKDISKLLDQIQPRQHNAKARSRSPTGRGQAREGSRHQ